MPNLVNSEKKIRDSDTVPSKITISYFFLFEHNLWTKGDLWVPQTWSSVNLLDHNKPYPHSCPISADFETCEKGSVFANYLSIFGIKVVLFI